MKNLRLKKHIVKQQIDVFRSRIQNNFKIKYTKRIVYGSNKQKKSLNLTPNKVGKMTQKD